MPDSDNYGKVQARRRNAKQTFRDQKKHYVRVNGWLPAMLAYADRHEEGVRYLTLCSKEALDVRYFAQKGALRRNEAANEYPGLTFVEENEEDYATIAESLGRYRLGVRGRLEDVLLDGTHASAGDLIASFPHDVVNLDFCGEITPKKDHPYSATLKCIIRVIELQSSAMPDWHLFLTFAVPSDDNNREANPQLLGNLNSNLQRQLHREAYGNRPEPDALLENNYSEFLRLGVMKFIASEAAHRGFRTSLETSYHYSRQAGAYRIVKAVIRFVPLRSPRDLPNAAEAQAAYYDSVEQVFRSESTNVDAALTQGVRQTLSADFAPVLEEITRSGVVSD